MDKMEVLDKIEKHYNMHSKLLAIARIGGDENDAHAHAGAMASLEMLRRDITGEKVYNV